MRYLGLLLMLAVAQPMGMGLSRVSPGQKPGAPKLVSIHMVTPLAGWGSTQTAILHTDDGWHHWQNVTPAMPGRHREEIGYLTLEARSRREAWLVGPTAVEPRTPTAILLYHTTDAGRIWERLPALATGPYNGVMQLQFIDAEHGWLWVIRGASMMQIAFDIYRTRDGGRHWEHVLSESDANAAPVRPAIGGGLPWCDCGQTISFLTPSTGWVAGCFCGIGNPPPLYFRTVNGGHTWRQALFPLPPGAPKDEGDVRAPIFFDRRKGILPVFVGLPRPAREVLAVYHTGDGGQSWHMTGAVRVAQVGDDLVSFVDRDHGFVLDGSRLDRTADGGRHWQSTPSGLNREHVSALDFVTPSVGFALESVGSSDVNRLLETCDGGRTWREPA